MPTPIPPRPHPPKIPTGQELYDAIMMNIEPELTTDIAKTLDAKYKDESPEDRAARNQKYDLAFERYEEAYKEYMATLDSQVHRYRREVLVHAEMEDRVQDEPLLDKISGFFQQPAV